MKQQFIKQLLPTALLLLLIAVFLTNCIKTSTRPNTTITKDTTTTVKVDTLPTFYNPAGLAIDAAGNIYVADYGNNLIRKITPAGIVSTVAGSGTAGTNNGIGVIAAFNQPKGIAVDASGTLYIADAGNNLIRQISATGIVTTLAGTDTTGTADGPGISAGFFGPAGVTIGKTGNLYVADAGNNLIRMITADGTVSTLAGSASGTTIINPTGVATDINGNIIVANNLNNNILQVTTGGVISTIAGTGQQGAANGAASLATFYFPNSLAVDAANNIYVADGVNNLIRKITPAGIVSTLAGSGVSGAVDSTGTAASFNGPSGLAVDAAGNVYVADTNNNLIRKITPAGVVTTLAGTGAAGSKNGKAFAHRNTTLIARPSGKAVNIWLKPTRKL